jgi:hypothetical protein
MHAVPKAGGGAFQDTAAEEKSQEENASVAHTLPSLFPGDVPAEEMGWATIPRDSFWVKRSRAENLANSLCFANLTKVRS